MTTELTTEQIVTNILIENETIRMRENNFYTMTNSLGDYLHSLPNSESSLADFDKFEKTRYSFIKDCGWTF